MNSPQKLDNKNNNCLHENLVLMESNEQDGKVWNVYQCLECFELMYEDFYIEEIDGLKIYTEIIGKEL